MQLKDLIPHEMTIPLALESFKNHLIKDNKIFRPILVDRNTLLVLDGHHRTQGLVDLGYKEGPAIMLDYLDDDIISIDTWYPLINKPLHEVMDQLIKAGLSVREYDSDINHFAEVSHRSYTAIMIGNGVHYVINGERELIFKKLRDHWLNDINYYDLATACADHATAEKTAIISWSYTKKELLDHVEQKKVHLPKTTRHVTKYRYPDCNFPLDKLARVDL